MKKLLLLSLIIVPLFIFGILILKNQSTTPEKSGAQNISPTPKSSKENVIDLDNLRVSWFEVSNIDNLKLIPNFSEKLSSQEVISNYNCKFLSNGPFYSKNSQPLGLFIYDGKTLDNWQENSLFDGILSINQMTTPRITRDIPTDGLQIAVQTGPILKENNRFQNLKIQEDKESRRIVAGVTGGNKLFFLVIYDPNSEYSGPLLENLPTVLRDFEVKSKITFADAINLDGGSASTFNSSNLKLSEINPSGAFFCQL